MITKFKSFAESFAVLAILVLLLEGCDQSARSWLRSFADYPPYWVVLQETGSDEKVEYWIGYLPKVHIEQIIRSEAEIADGKDGFQADPSTVPERIYYIFESPNPSHQHEWNIKVDEPNYIYKWHKGELTLLKEHKGTARDKQNKFVDANPIAVPASN